MVAFPFLMLFINMKSCLKYIDKAIKFEINKIIKEDNVTGLGSNLPKDAEGQIQYDDDELKKLDSDIKNLKNWEIQAQSDIKGFQQKQRLAKDPIEKSIATTSLSKIATPKEKQLKDMITQKEKDKTNLDAKIKSDNLKLTAAKKGISIPSGNESIANAGMIPEANKKTSLPMMKRNFFTEQEVLPAQPPVQPPSNKAYLVKFDKETQRPFEAKFTERGFSIEGTRLSFEALENALSKNYTITLSNGKGLMLDAIRMQKILKYKNRFFNGQ